MIGDWDIKDPDWHHGDLDWVEAEV